MPDEKSSLEMVYHSHHTLRREPFFLVQEADRGNFLRRHIGTGKRVLDLGCRDGALTKTYCEGNDVVGVDIDRDALLRAREALGIEVKHVDLNGDWHLPAGEFDAVVAGEVIEHLYYPDIVLEKIKHVLKPGGILVGSVPHAFSIQNRMRLLLARKENTPMRDPTHINHFSCRELSELMRQNFDSVELVGLSRKKYQLVPNQLRLHLSSVILFCCKKATS